MQVAGKGWSLETLKIEMQFQPDGDILTFTHP